MERLKTQDLIGTKLERTVFALMTRRNSVSKNKHLPPNEIFTRFPKIKCPLDGCYSEFSVLGNYKTHLKKFHKEFLNELKSSKEQ